MWLASAIATLLSITVAQASTAPYTNNFDNVGLIDLNGTGGWTAPANAFTNQNSITNSPTNAAILSEATATNLFTTANATNTWIEFYTIPSFREFHPTNHPSVATGDDEAVFYVNTNGYITAYDGSGSGSWVILSNTAVGGNVTPLTTGRWVRITVAMHYTNKTYSIFVNNKLHGDSLGFKEGTANTFVRFTIVQSNDVSYLDDVAVDTNNASSTPTGGGGDALTDDSDFDLIPDWWEIYYFQTIDYAGDADPDGDEFTNNDEYNAGTDPTNGSDFPATPLYALPWFEPFEELVTSPTMNLHGQHGWSNSLGNSSAAIVQTTNVYLGSQAGAFTGSESRVWFNDATATNVWTSMRLVARGSEAPSGVGITNGAAALYLLNEDNEITAWNGSNNAWTVYTTDANAEAIPAISTGSWIRLVSHCNYDNGTWSLFYSDSVTNRILTTVATNLGFADTSLTVYKGFSITNGSSTYADVDDIAVTATRPDEVDLDNNEVGDNFEDLHLDGNPNPDWDDDPDGDGLNNLQEYIAGTNPTNSDSFFRITAADVSYPHVDVVVQAGTNRNIYVWEATTYGGSSSLMRETTNQYWGATSVTLRDGNVAGGSAGRKFYVATVTYGGVSVTGATTYIMNREVRTRNTWHLTSVPADYGANNTLDSTLGSVLARGLVGNDTEGNADMIYLVTTNNGYVTNGFYLNGSGVWLTNGTVAGAADVAVDPMRGMFVKRANTGPTTTNSLLTGPVYTNTTSRIIRAGDSGANTSRWHLIAWPFPNSRSITASWSDGDGFGLDSAGATNGTSWSSSDRLLLPDSTGRRYALFLHTSGVWRIKDTRTTATDFTIQPGQVIQYYHTGTNSFTYSPDWTP